MAEAIVSGILSGGLYGLIAMGLSVVFGTMRFVNFAHGAFVMVGMYVAYYAFMLLGIAPLLALPIVLAVFVTLVLALRATLLRNIERSSELSQMFITLGVAIVLENLATVAFGPNARTISAYSKLYVLGPVFVGQAQLIAFIVAVVVAIAFYVWEHHSDAGLALRMVVSDRGMASSLGVDPERVYTIGLVIGLGLAGLAGAILVSYYPVSPTAGATFLVLAFVAVTIGGLGNIYGAFVGGIVVGVLQQLSALFLSTDLQNVVVFAAFVAVLIVRTRNERKLRPA